MPFFFFLQKSLVIMVKVLIKIGVQLLDYYIIFNYISNTITKKEFLPINAEVIKN